MDVLDAVLKEFKDLYRQKKYQECLVACEKFVQEDSRIISSHQLYAQIYHIAAQAASFLDKTEIALGYYRKFHLYNIQLFNEYSNREDIVVYSFRKVNEYALADLKNNMITLAPPNKMNDPLDSLYLLWAKNISDLYTEKNIDEPVYLSLYKESFKNFRIRSFVANDTATSDDSIIQNMLMWSHYAGEHAGYCIKYRLSKYFIKDFDEKKENTHFVRKIYYPKEDGINIDIAEGRINSETAFFIKHPLWKYENELRLLSYNAHNEKEFPDIVLDKNSKIEDIYFGCRCSDQDKKLIKDIASNGSNNHINFYELKYNIKDVYNFQVIEY